MTTSLEFQAPTASAEIRRHCNQCDPSHAKSKSLSINQSDGVYFCHRCEAKGSIAGTNNNATQDEKLDSKQAKQRKYEAAAVSAQKEWDTLRESGEHPYLDRKNVNPYGVRFGDDFIAVPMRSPAGNLRGLQKIYANGDKRFTTGMRKKGSCHLIQGDPKTIVVCEGFATAASIHEATNYCVAVAFDANNLGSILSALKAMYPDSRFIVASDNDQWTKGNPGATKATQAAIAHSADIIIVNFEGLDGSGRPTDFNDLHVLVGLDVVRQQIEAAEPPEPKQSEPGTEANTAAQLDELLEPEWPEPEALPTVGDAAPCEYPANALPPVLLYAAQEVSRFCKVPLPSAATVGLSIAATAIGKSAKVVERNGLSHWPALFFALVTGSGERKSPVFRLLQQPLLDWIDDQLPTYEQEKQVAAALNMVIDAQIQGKKSAAKKAGVDFYQIAAEIAKLEGQRSITPAHPRMFTSNATPEMLFRLMDTHEGAYAVLSGEGRDVIDNIIGRYQSDGRTGDSIYLAGITGDTITRDRIGSADHGPEERFIADPCLNVCIMVQPDKYFEMATHASLRGSGAIARIWPVLLPQMAGTRLEAADEPDLNQQPVSAFGHALNNLLSLATESTLKFTLAPEAKSARRDFHNEIEVLLSGELADVKDIAAKAVSQTVKLCLILHLLENPEAFKTEATQIGVTTWDRAESLGLFYLTEAVRTMRAAQDDQTMDAARIVLQWIKTKKLNVLTASDIARRSPRPRPNAKEAREILDILAYYGWVREKTDPTKRKPVFEVNPALIRQNSQNSQQTHEK